MKTKNTVERIQLFIAAWESEAADAVFAGMTLAQFKVAVARPVELQEEILGLELDLKMRKIEKDKADTAADLVMELVINSVRGNPEYGADSEAYCAFGYIRKSDRKSGLTRKVKAPPVEDKAA